MKIRRIISTIAAAALAVSLSACALFNKPKPGNIGDIVLADGDLVAEITIEGYGTVKAKLFPDLAPNAVENFKRLCEQGYYDGLKIHRVAPDSMMQGGSLNGDGTGGTAILDNNDSFAIETSDKARNFYGALGYANVDGENTTQFYIVNSKSVDDPADYDKAIAELTAERDKYEADSEGYEYYNYYIESYTKTAEKLRSLSDKYKEQGGTPSLDDDYTVFGQVVEGFDVIDNISAVEVTTGSSGENSKPVKDIIIKSVKVYAAD